MPHKHRRDKKSLQDQFELPPNSAAKPLPTKPSISTSTQTDKKKARTKRKRAHKDNDDDTPRAFARLMSWKQGIKPSSGLDDGAPRSKRRKGSENQKLQLERSGNSESTSATTTTTAVAVPTIMPGERMADYSARVDAALPLTGLSRRGKNIVLPGVKRPQTKMERKIQKMQNEWRNTDARYKERLREAEEEAEDDEDPHQEILNKHTKKGRRKIRGPGSDDDPWAVVAKARKEQAQANSGLVGIHDVVQAPPELKAPKERFKTRNGAKVDVMNVPTSAGSLMKREQLGKERKSIVEGYRHTMKERRGTSVVL